MKKRTDLAGALIIGLASLAGVAAFAYPFFLRALPASGLLAHQEDALAALALLVTLCLGATLAELTTGRMNARSVATMGILVAINAALRLAENALIALPGGFSPVFFLIILCGYVFGPRFGFLYGALSLLVSALATGGVGPWLPYQMFTAGWVGLSAGWLSPLTARLRTAGWERALLVLFGFLWGLLYGAIINLYFWPYIGGTGSGAWEPGIGLLETLGRYATFYGVTSLWWDMARAVGNVVLLAAFGPPVLRVLRRFRRRFRFTVEPEWEAAPPA
jgi:energy-coupling factor transport system substrate-specific component